jgi:hypothetical protein
VLEHLETWDLTTLTCTSPRLRLAAFPALRAAAFGGDAAVLCAAAALPARVPLLRALLAAGAPLATGADDDCPLRASIVYNNVPGLRVLFADARVRRDAVAPLDLEDARPVARDALRVACDAEALDSIKFLLERFEMEYLPFMDAAELALAAAFEPAVAWSRADFRGDYFIAFLISEFLIREHGVSSEFLRVSDQRARRLLRVPERRPGKPPHPPPLPRGGEGRRRGAARARGRRGPGRGRRAQRAADPRGRGRLRVSWQ